MSEKEKFFCFSEKDIPIFHKPRSNDNSLEILLRDIEEDNKYSNRVFVIEDISDIVELDFINYEYKNVDEDRSRMIPNETYISFYKKSPEYQYSLKEGKYIKLFNIYGLLDGVDQKKSIIKIIENDIQGQKFPIFHNEHVDTPIGYFTNSIETGEEYDITEEFAFEFAFLCVQRIIDDRKNSTDNALSESEKEFIDIFEFLIEIKPAFHRYLIYKNRRSEKKREERNKGDEKNDNEKYVDLTLFQEFLRVLSLSHGNIYSEYLGAAIKSRNSHNPFIRSIAELTMAFETVYFRTEKMKTPAQHARHYMGSKAKQYFINHGVSKASLDVNTELGLRIFLSGMKAELNNQAGIFFELLKFQRSMNYFFYD